jgi:hypothetical protein
MGGSLYSQGDYRRPPQDKSLDGREIRSRFCGGEKSVSRSGFEPDILSVQPVAHRSAGKAVPSPDTNKMSTTQK